MSQRQKPARGRRKASGADPCNPHVQVGATVESLLNDIETIREAVVQACDQVKSRDDSVHQSTAPDSSTQRLERCSQELSSIVDGAKKLKKLCSQLCLSMETGKYMSSLDTSSKCRDVTIESDILANGCEKPVAGPSFSRDRASSEVSEKREFPSTRSAVNDGSANVELFSQMLLDFYASIRSGRIAIRADDTVCLKPIPQDVCNVVSHVLADCDVTVLLALFETVLSEHVRKIRDSLVAIVCKVLCRGEEPQSLLVTQSHAYCLVKLYLDEYRALVAGAKSVAQILSNAFDTRQTDEADVSLEKELCFNWECMNKHVFYTLVFNDQLVHKWVAACVRKLNTVRPRKLFSANRTITVAISKHDPVMLCEEASLEQVSESPVDTAELQIKCTAAELLERVEQVHSELESKPVKRFLLDALQQTQSSAASGKRRRRSADDKLSATASADEQPCCAKCGTPHLISADAERIARLLADNPLFDSAARSSDDTPPASRARHDPLEAVRRMLNIPNTCGSVDYGESSDGETEETDESDESDAHNPPTLAANAFSRSQDLLEEPSLTGADWVQLSPPKQAGPYYLLNTGNILPPNQTPEQLDDFCKAVFSPVMYSQANFALPQTSTGLCDAAASESVALHPVVINGQLCMLVNGADCSTVAAQPTQTTVNVVPGTPDEIVRVLCSSLPNDTSQSSERPVSTHVQHGVVFIDGPGLQLPNTDQSVDFHTKPPRVTVQGHFSDDDAAEHDNADVAHDESPSAASEGDAEDEYEGVYDHEPVDASGDAQPGECHCQRCALYGRPALTVQRSQRELDKLERLRKKLARKKGAVRTLGISQNLPLRSEGLSEEVLAVETTVPKVPETLKERLIDPPPSIVRCADVGVSAGPIQSEADCPPEPNVDDLVRFIEGRAADPTGCSTFDKLKSSKSEKRKKKKEKHKLEVALAKVKQAKSCNDVSTKPTSSLVQKNSNTEKQPATAPSSPEADSKSKSVVSKQKGDKRRNQVTRESRKTTDDAKPSNTVHKNSTRSPSFSNDSRQRTLPAAPRDTSSSNSYDQPKDDELVIPDFGEVPISMDTSKAKQHKAKASRSSAVAQARAAPSAKAAASHSVVSAPSAVSDTFKLPSGKKAEIGSRQQTQAKVAATDENGNPTARVALPSASVSATPTDPAKSPTSVQVGASASGNKSSAQDRDRMNPRYRNGIKLEAFVRNSLRPEPSPLDLRSRACASNFVSPGARNTDCIPGSVVSNGSFASFPNDSHRNARRSERLRTYQNSSYNAAQMTAQSQSQSQAQSQRAQAQNAANCSRRRARNFYGPQYANSSVPMQSTAFVPFEYRGETNSADADGTALWDTYEGDGASSGSYTVYNSGVDSGSAWDSSWLSSASQAQHNMAWSANDGRNGDSLSNAFASYSLESDTTPNYGLEYAAEQADLQAFPFDGQPVDSDIHAPFSTSYDCSGYLDPNSNHNSMADNSNQYANEWAALPDQFAPPQAAAPFSFADGQQNSFAHLWNSPPCASTLQQAPNDANLLNLKGSLFDRLHNRDHLPAASHELCNAAMDEHVQDADDDFDPEIEQFKQICLNGTVGETRERPRVQVNLSEIFKKKP